MAEKHELRHIVEHSVKHLKKVQRNSSADSFYKSNYDKYKKLEGKRAVWKTKNSPIVKAPKLVKIIKAYQYYILVEATNITYDGSRNNLTYCIEYASLLSGFDRLRILD